MDTLIHADIFFFVTTIAVIVITVILIVVLIYLVQILRRVRDVADQVREETILFREDVHDLRDQVKLQGARAKFFIDFIKKFFDQKKSKKAKE